jgi:hypothetical protein
MALKTPDRQSTQVQLTPAYYWHPGLFSHSKSSPIKVMDPNLDPALTATFANSTAEPSATPIASTAHPEAFNGLESNVSRDDPWF